MPKHTLNLVDPTNQLCFGKSNAFHLNKQTWFAASSAYDLNIDMPKRTLNLVDSANQLCFVELNVYNPEKQTWFARLISNNLNKQT